VSALLLILGVARAQEAGEVDLRKEVQNPVGSLTKVDFANISNLDAGGLNNNSYVLQTQVVTPFPLDENWLLVPRFIVNAPRYQAGATSGTSGITGFGDSTSTFFLSPTRVGRVIWGVGPTFLLPTATRTSTGQGKWGLGPAIGVFTQPMWGTIGLIVQNTWSVAGDSHRANVNKMALQLSAQYNLPQNWYLTTQPEIDANWDAARGSGWFVPLGGGIGKVCRMGRQSFAGTLLVYRNVARVDTIPSPKWQVIAALTFLFPKGESITTEE
jgi:hypothetical protein